MAMNISEEELLLRKRARRRLLGAITLVIMAIIILPMIFDDEFKLELEQHEIAIHMPSVDSVTDFSPSLLDLDNLPPADTYQEAVPAAQLPIQPLGAGRVNESPVDDLVKQNLTPVPKTKPSINKAEIKTNSVAINNNPPDLGAEFVIQLGAFSDHSKAKQQQQNLIANGVKAYTETLRVDNKEMMRVRIGAFSTRKSAEVELVKLKQLGFNGVVTAK